MKYGPYAKKDDSRTAANKMSFMQQTLGCTKCDHRENENIKKELVMLPILDEIHQNQMIRSRMPKVLRNYQPNEKRPI